MSPIPMSTPSVSDETLDRLEALARLATPGPWQVGMWDGRCHKNHKHGGKTGDDPCVYEPELSPTIPGIVQKEPSGTVIGSDYDGATGKDIDLRYIAACDPQTILALIAQSRRAEPSPAAGAGEPALAVERIETVAISDPFDTQPSDPIWRVRVFDVCADFETEKAANNMRDAILRLAAPTLAENATVAATPPSGARSGVAMRLETAAEHVARDLKEGRFPERSEPQLVPDVPDPWDAIGNDPQLAAARRKLSIHEIRLIIKHAQAALSTPPDADFEIDSRGIDALAQGEAERRAALATPAPVQPDSVGRAMASLSEEQRQNILGDGGPTPGGDGRYCTHHGDDPAHGPACYEPAAPVQPEGWKLVPVASTPEMQLAGSEARSSGLAIGRNTVATWDAMVAAAPEPPRPYQRSAGK